VLGLGPDKEKVSGYQATYQLLRDWAERHPEYRMLIKKHPRSYMEFWETAEHQLGNVHVLPRASTLAEALGQASIVVNIVSNAVIEATLAQRPILFVNCGNDRDILSQARFFGGKISTMEMLEHGMDALQQNYLDSCRRSADFAEYHLAFGIQGMRQTIDDLERLLAGDAPQACTEVVENTI
jgi:CDP-glycerol glycerophosphotransferase (TagB/SpsB family)